MARARKKTNPTKPAATKTTAVYAGSFDPPTLGHIDVVKRGLKMFAQVVVAIGVNPAKKPAMSVEDRVRLLEASLADEPRVQVQTFEGLLIDYCQRIGAQAILRGLRVTSDFDYEFQLGLANRDLAPEVETVFVLAAKEHIFLSSSIVREIASHGHPVDRYVPSAVAKEMRTWKPPPVESKTAAERRLQRSDG